MGGWIRKIFTQTCVYFPWANSEEIVAGIEVEYGELAVECSFLEQIIACFFFNFFTKRIVILHIFINKCIKHLKTLFKNNGNNVNK